MVDVRLENVRKEFNTSDGTVTAVDNLDLFIEDSTFLSFLGPSGCGKTTTLRMIAGLERPTGGEIYFDDEPITDLPPQERDIGMVFQSVALFPHMTIRDNIGYGLKVKKDTENIDERIEDVAKILQIEDQLDKKPNQLSGGQKQRVSLGRAIVREPNLILFDEPLSDLDAKLKSDLRVEIQRIHQEYETTMIYVTHDQMEATTMSDDIAIMDNGKLMQHGGPQELFDDPNNAFVGEFVGHPSMNFVDGILQGDSIRINNGKELRIEHEFEQATERSVLFGLRPQHISLSTDMNESLLTGNMRLWEPLGTEFIVYLESGDRDFTVISDEVPPVEIGEVIGIGSVNKFYIFDAESEAKLFTVDSSSIIEINPHSAYQ